MAAEDGIAGLSLREVADRVGMRTPSLYSYFGSKQDLFDAMFAAGNRALIAHVQDMDQPADAHERARAYLRGFVGFCVAEPGRYQRLSSAPFPASSSRRSRMRWPRRRTS